MIDWTKSMQQTFKYYVVNPETWGNAKELTDVVSSSVSRDSEDELLESATIDKTDAIDECYVRVYLVCIQNGVEYQFSLGTFLVQTPNIDHDGRNRKVSMEAYSPLQELKDSSPPYGYSIRSGANILDTAVDIISEHTRTPVVPTKNEVTLTDMFVSDYDNDSWLSFVSDLLAVADYRIGLDELGRIIFVPTKETKTKNPVWVYNDNNSSILYPEISLKRDLYDIPNVVEVLYSSDTGFKFARAENKNDNSEISIQNRGREIVYRESNPEGLVNPTQAQIEVYAKELLKSLSTVEYEVTYSHGYCPVRVGDCVELNYTRAGISGITATVKSQSIDCENGCKVSEVAVFTDTFHTINVTSSSGTAPTPGGGGGGGGDDPGGGGGGGGGSGTGGTNDYEQLINLPSIEGVTLIGNRTFPELNLNVLSNLEIEDLLS